MDKFVVHVSNNDGVTGCWVANATFDMAEKASHTIAGMIAEGKGFVLGGLNCNSKAAVPGNYVSQHAWKVSIINQTTEEEV